MKNLIALTILALGVFVGTAQTEENDSVQESDTTKINLGDDTQLILVSKGDEIDVSFNEGSETSGEDHEDSGDFTYWSGIDLGFVGVDVASNDEWFDIREQNSTAFSLNILEKKIRLLKHHVGLNTGLGFTWQSYSFNDSLNIEQQNDTIVGVSSNGREYTKNKLKAGYIKVPLLLEINTSKKQENNFHIAAGLIAGWNYRSVLKQRYEVDGDDTKLKTKGDYNINPFSLEATARMGYGKFNLFATASLTELFQSGKGPEVYPFTVGVSLVSF